MTQYGIVNIQKLYKIFLMMSLSYTKLITLKLTLPNLILHILPRNSKTTNHKLLYNNQTITPRKSEDIIRYLGIFYDGKGSTKPTLDMIYNKIENFLILIQKIVTFANIFLIQPYTSTLFRIFLTNRSYS